MIQLPRTIAGYFNLHTLFASSPHLLEIMYHAVITAAISNPHSSCTIITNMPIKRYFMVYAESVQEGIGITFGPLLCHLRFQCMNFSQRKLKTSLHWKDMTQLPIITRFYVIAETVFSAKTADADYYSTGKFYICRKSPGWSSSEPLCCLLFLQAHLWALTFGPEQAYSETRVKSKT